jgi:hypothetical protein
MAEVDGSGLNVHIDLIDMNRVTFMAAGIKKIRSLFSGAHESKVTFGAGLKF